MIKIDMREYEKADGYLVYVQSNMLVELITYIKESFKDKGLTISKFKQYVAFEDLKIVEHKGKYPRKHLHDIEESQIYMDIDYYKDYFVCGYSTFYNKSSNCRNSINTYDSFNLTKNLQMDKLSYIPKKLMRENIKAWFGPIPYTKAITLWDFQLWPYRVPEYFKDLHVNWTKSVMEKGWYYTKQDVELFLMLITSEI